MDYATAGGSAEPGADFVAASGRLVFASETTEQSVGVAIVDDALSEGEESFTLVLSNPANAALAGGGAALSATGAIADDD